MQNYKMKIAYDGNKYMGYNKMKNNPEKSIQGKLELILEKLYNEKIEVISAVNTDMGVHAEEQVVNFVVPDDRMNEEGVLNYFEKYLPDDIIVLSVEAVDERFHSKYLAKSVTYQYRLWKKNAQRRPLFERKYVNLMVQDLNVDDMKEAAKLIEGEHDFLAFTSNKKTRKSVKKMIELNIDETEYEIVFTLKANGFLLHMGRIIVGTLIQIGLGQLTIDVVEKAFESKNNEDVGHKSSAGAFCLLGVEY